MLKWNPSFPGFDLKDSQHVAIYNKKNDFPDRQAVCKVGRLSRLSTEQSVIVLLCLHHETGNCKRKEVSFKYLKDRLLHCWPWGVRIGREESFGSSTTLSNVANGSPGQGFFWGFSWIVPLPPYRRASRSFVVQFWEDAEEAPLYQGPWLYFVLWDPSLLLKLYCSVGAGTVLFLLILVTFPFICIILYHIAVTLGPYGEWWVWNLINKAIK